eukprot:jgi/Mesen1/2040/ME000149S01034
MRKMKPAGKMTSPNASKPPLLPLPPRKSPTLESPLLSPDNKLPNIIAPGPQLQSSFPDAFGPSGSYHRRYLPTTSVPTLPTIESPPSLESLKESKSEKDLFKATSYDFRRGRRCQGVQQRGAHGAAINEWIVPLMVFTIVSLGIMVASLVYCVNIVDIQKRQEIGVFLHISDIHYDPLYRVGATPRSSCRGSKVGQQDWVLGQYGCDSPLSLLKSATGEMARVGKHADFIVVTGDSVAHNVSSPEDTLDALAQVDWELQGAFPNGGTKIVYVVGEAELAPALVLFPHRSCRNGSSHKDWLAQLAVVWNDSLSQASDNAVETFARGGYYLALIEARASSNQQRQPTNMAVIVLNTLYYAVGAFGAAHGGGHDPAGQLAWLRQELASARHWGRTVMIAGHVPPGVNTVGGGPLWHAEYEASYSDIMLEYSDIIVAQVFGYLHRDHFRLMQATIAAPKSGTDSDGTAGDRLEGTNLGSSGASKASRLDATAAPAGRSSGRKLLEEVSDVRQVSNIVTGSGLPELTGGSRSGTESGGRLEGANKAQEDRGSKITVDGEMRSEAQLFQTLVQFGRADGREERVRLDISRSGGEEARDGQLVQSERRESNASAVGGVKLGAVTPGGSWFPDRLLPFLRLSREAGGSIVPRRRGGAAAGSDRWRPGRRGQGGKDSSVSSTTGSVILMVPSLSPVFDNRPAFRLFRYDRWRSLLDYTEHSADFEAPLGHMWKQQYTAKAAYGLQRLDSEELSWLSSAFFDPLGYPTELFGEFCALRAAGNKLVTWADGYDCCQECPRAMHCAQEYATYAQYRACQQDRLP